MDLYVLYIGGSHEKAIVELHDTRICVAEKLEDTFDAVTKTWWGTPGSLHIDAWGILRWADGYKIDIQQGLRSTVDGPHLYFVNLGGYDSQQFTELHKNVFVIAENESKAKVKALKGILDWQAHHRDYQFNVENITNVSATLGENDCHIRLTPQEEPLPFDFHTGMIPLGKDM